MGAERVDTLLVRDGVIDHKFLMWYEVLGVLRSKAFKALMAYSFLSIGWLYATLRRNYNRLMIQASILGILMSAERFLFYTSWGGHG